MSDIQARVADINQRVSAHLISRGRLVAAINSAATLILLLATFAAFGLAASVGAERQHQINLANQESSYVSR